MNEDTIREKVERGIIPVKAELIWFVILLLAVAAAIYGMKAAYSIGYRHGVYDEKIGLLENHRKDASHIGRDKDGS